MASKKLMKGCEALGEAAIQAGARAFFGYPITPQTEVPEYLSKRFPEVGGVFLQAESEVASSNMLYGAAGAGARVFSSTSSPGYSLMAEGISYMAGAELPAVIINIIRGGPGLGGILPSQGDYLQATKGAGHGDYKNIVLAPSTVQEAADLMMEAFDLADKYRNPVVVAGDGLIGQMMEPVEFRRRTDPESLPAKAWATTGSRGRERNLINSLYLDARTLEEHNIKLRRKYDRIEAEEQRWEEYGDEGEVELLVVAFGTVARVAKSAVDDLQREGKKAAVFRPITLWPFPYDSLRRRIGKAAHILVAEMSMGQMVEDVRLAAEGKAVSFFGRGGGAVPSPEEVFAVANRVLGGEELCLLGDPLQDSAREV
jgi:2-oxoglutarate ferredoxin oxidoreductase subunit alpha